MGRLNGGDHSRPGYDATGRMIRSWAQSATNDGANNGDVYGPPRPPQQPQQSPSESVPTPRVPERKPPIDIRRQQQCEQAQRELEQAERELEAARQEEENLGRQWEFLEEKIQNLSKKFEQQEKNVDVEWQQLEQILDSALGELVDIAQSGAEGLPAVITGQGFETAGDAASERDKTDFLVSAGTIAGGRL